MEIIPAVLAKTTQELADIKNKLEWYSGPLHIDIGDGQLVSTVTVGREEISQAFPNRPLQLHLMVDEPENVVSLWLDMPNLQSIIFHIEATDKASEIIDTIHQAGKRSSVAIKPETDIELLEPLIGKANFFHFMTVDPGNYGGQFQERVIQKISDFRNHHAEVAVSVDGGVTPENAKMLIEAGAMNLVVGSYIQNSDNPQKAYEKF